MTFDVSSTAMSGQPLKGSGGKLGPMAPLIESVFELAQGRADEGRQSRRHWRELRHAGSEDAAIDSGNEQGRAEAEGGQLVAMGCGDAADQSVQA